jgi:dTDP-4-amino-4,6-dideoxy-D-galactose acyltransferase
MVETSFLQPLTWDTERLNVKVARIMPEQLDEVAFHHCLSLAKQQGFQLLYWAVPSENAESIQHAKQHGMLVDHKVIYLISLQNIVLPALDDIKVYTEIKPSEELTQLAFEAGKYSRFRNDARLSNAQFESVYREWIINSTNHSIAAEVLVTYDDNRLSGMVTLGKKNDRGDIGLLAVAEHARGKKIGTKLVQAAQKYFIEKGFIHSQVVTQQENVAACRLYEKCGYHVEKLEYFFHFWL